jgi:hypothetical protein
MCNSLERTLGFTWNPGEDPDFKDREKVAVITFFTTKKPCIAIQLNDKVFRQGAEYSSGVLDRIVNDLAYIVEHGVTVSPIPDGEEFYG